MVSMSEELGFVGFFIKRAPDAQEEDNVLQISAGPKEYLPSELTCFIFFINAGTNID